MTNAHRMFRYYADLPIGIVRGGANGHFVAQEYPDEMCPGYIPVESPWAEEAFFDTIVWLADEKHIPAWDWSGRITDNPFMSGRDKFELAQTCIFLSHTIDSCLPD